MTLGSRPQTRKVAKRNFLIDVHETVGRAVYVDFAVDGPLIVTEDTGFVGGEPEAAARELAGARTTEPARL